MDVRNEFWMKEVLGLDLPETNTCSYELTEHNLKTAAISSYVQLLQAIGSIIYSSGDTSKLKDLLSLIWPETRFLVLQLAVRDFSFLRRLFFFLAIIRWKAAHRRDPSSFLPQFYLQGNILRKKHPAPFAEEWSIELQPIEKSVLCYLYHFRRRTEILDAFAGEYSANAIDEVLVKHQKLRSIVQYKKLYIAVFLDPDGASSSFGSSPKAN